jgi:hypothetical protein
MKSAVILSLILLVGAVSNAQKVSSGYDKSINFSGYKSYVFSSTQGARNPLVNEMIIAAVERELGARGLTKVDANGDLRVSYLAATGYNLQVGEAKFGYNVNPAYVGLVPTGTPATMDVVTGTLVIDLFDNKTDRIIFRGTAKDVLQRAPGPDPVADAKLVGKTVNNAITKMFKKYPKP